MAATYKLLTSHGAQIASTAGAVYTVPSSTTTYLRSIRLHNTNTTTETVKLYLVENGGSVTDSRLILNIDVETNETVKEEASFPIVLETAGDTIQAVTDTASKVNILMFGREDT